MPENQAEVPLPLVQSLFCLEEKASVENRFGFWALKSLRSFVSEIEKTRADILMSALIGGSGWIRTTEVVDVRFTV